MKVLILFCVVAAAFASRQVCRQNQIYKECGTACPLTCDNYDNPPKICPAMCVSGCHCEEGFVKTRGGRCIRPEECPAGKRQVCRQNQIFKECGTACPITCDNYNNPPKICPAMCVSGCHCEEGFVKTRGGRCIRPEECPAKARPVVKTCLEKPDGGMCLAYMPQWYYNAEEGKCYEFIYGGCQGNGNRYATEEECLTHCGKVCGENKLYQECGSACPLTCENYNNPPKICPAMCVPGCHCEKGYVKTKDGRCVKPEDCPARAHPVVKTCLEEPDKGRCLAYMPRWYYNSEEGKCYKFIYGGCQGNGNRYKTEEECLEHCGTRMGPKACQEEKVVGPCKAAFKRFYFNKDSGKCEEFTYGGCSGNSNNFNSLEECEAVCAA